MPWQYSRSQVADNLASMEFRGERLSLDEKRIVKLENRTPFPAPRGSAALPGTQISYPAFFNDRRGGLYITYRFATRPEQSWTDRGFAAGLAMYDERTDVWTHIGAPPGSFAAANAARVFAFDEGWTPYLLRLAFDRENSMHAVLSWAEGGPQTLSKHPSYTRLLMSDLEAASRGVEQTSLPVRTSGALIAQRNLQGKSFFAGIGVAPDSKNAPHLLLQSASGERWLTSFDQRTGWAPLQRTPDGATAIWIDESDNIWAVATGPRIFVRRVDSHAWRLMYAANGWCYPKLHRSAKRNLWLQLQSCDLRSIRVMQILENDA
jgi:hypothetical protein